MWLANRTVGSLTANLVVEVALREFCIPAPGSPPQLRERPTPIAGAGEVLVAVEAVGLNYSDVLRAEDPRHLPYVPGAEIAGAIAAVGPGVDLTVGAPVVALLPSRGGCADVVAVPAEHLLDRGAIPAERAAASMLTFLTAMLAIEGCDLSAGDTALVHAAGGGVGTAAVQLLRAGGVVAVGLATTREKARVASRLGAAAVYDPSDPDVLSRLASDYPEGFDGILDGVGGAAAWTIDVGAARTGATIAIYGFAGGSQICVDIHGHLVAKGLRIFGFAASDATLLHERVDRLRTDLVPALESGGIGPVVDVVLPITRLGAGLRRLASRRVAGKLVVRL